MIQIAHEAPKSIFKTVQSMTDYDYALVHLFEKDPEYFDLFRSALSKGREVILDNSVFELEEAFDPDKFLTWIKLLKPTYYIVPDALEDADRTIVNMQNWIDTFEADVPRKCKKIGVVQGQTYEDLVRCYQYMDKVAKVDKIAISFDYSYYRKVFPHPNKLISWAFGRVKLLGDLVRDGILNKEKPHHLLGCGTPGEGILYNTPDFNFIDSVDTSNPVVHGLKGIRYEGSLGLFRKESTKLCDLINVNVTEKQQEDILNNILDFKLLWEGNYGTKNNSLQVF